MRFLSILFLFRFQHVCMIVYRTVGADFDFFSFFRFFDDFDEKIIEKSCISWFTLLLQEIHDFSKKYMIFQ